MITQMIQKQFFCVTDVCVIGKVILTCVVVVVGGSVHGQSWVYLALWRFSPVL